MKASPPRPLGRRDFADNRHMARTRSPDFEERQQRILRSAAELFASRGYSETLLEDIAEHCGVKRSSIYHYHESKHALLHGLITWKIEDLSRKVESALQAVIEPRARLETLVATLIGEYVESPHEITILNTQTRHLDAEALQATAQLQDRIIGHARSALLALRPEAPMARATSAVLTMSLFGMVNWVHVWYKPDRGLEPAKVASLITDVFLDGMLNLPAASLA